MVPLSTEAWSLSRLPPVPAALVSSAKTFLAAMLALYIAFAVGLDRPAWAMATTYIVSQPIAGAALAKGFYRIIGTIIGGMFTLFTVPALVDAPVLLTLALSLWIGGSLFLSLRDRSPRSYVFMLAGYSAAIMGFPNVDDPTGLFIIVSTRIQEIGLGIICATLVAALVLPQTSHASALARILHWLRSADKQAAGLLTGTLSRTDMAHGERGLANEIARLHGLMVYLSYEPSVSPTMRRNVRSLYDRTVLMLRFLVEVRDRLVALRQQGPLAPEFEDLMARTAAWASQGRASDEAEGRACADALDRFADAEASVGGWHAATLLNLAVRVRQYIDVREDCRTLWQALEDEQPATGLRSSITVPPPPLPSIDSGNAARAALALILALWGTAAAWIFTAWPDGATAMMMVSIAGSVTASQLNPIPALFEFIWAALIALVFVFIYQFAVLPVVGDFFQLALALAPFLLAAGTLMALPAHASLGFGIAVTATTLLGLQNTFGNDLAGFANGNSAAVAGMCAITIAVSLLRPNSAAQATAHLLRRSWADVAAIAALPDHAARAGIARGMLDRLGLLAPTLTPRRGDEGEIAFASVFAAEGVLGLADLEPYVSVSARPDFDRLLGLTAAHYGAMVRNGRADANELIDTIETIRQDMAASSGAIARQGLIALVSLRRGVLLGQERADEAGANVGAT